MQRQMPVRHMHSIYGGLTVAAARQASSFYMPLLLIEVLIIMQCKLVVSTITLSLIVTLALPSSVLAQPVLVPGEKSLLYYKMGGGEPVSRAANPLHTPLKI